MWKVYYGKRMIRLIYRLQSNDYEKKIWKLLMLTIKCKEVDKAGRSIFFIQKTKLLYLCHLHKKKKISGISHLHIDPSFV